MERLGGVLRTCRRSAWRWDSTEFGRLTPAEAEDCPCIYKEVIRRVMR